MCWKAARDCFNISWSRISSEAGVLYLLEVNSGILFYLNLVQAINAKEAGNGGLAYSKILSLTFSYFSRVFLLFVVKSK